MLLNICNDFLTTKNHSKITYFVISIKNKFVLLFPFLTSICPVLEKKWILSPTKGYRPFLFHRLKKLNDAYRIVIRIMLILIL